MEQMDLALEVPQPPAKRRIDVTLEKLDEEFNALPAEERAKLIQRPWVHALEMMAALRGMEIAEDEAMGRSRPGLAEAYDRIVMPGDHPIEALLHVFREYLR